MTKSTKFRSLRYRVLVIAAFVVCLTALLAPTTSPQSTACCTQCLQRFQQCDSNSIVCCKIYNACVSQCSGSCPTCPDTK
jgi:hypothetical protein